MKNSHSVRYYEKCLLKLRRVADSIGYPIFNNTDYRRAAEILPLSVELGGTGKETIPAAFFRHYSAACETVEMARREAAKA